MDQLGQFLLDPDRLENIWQAYADRWWLSVGIQELLENSVGLGGDRRILAAILKKAQARYSHQNRLDRWILKVLWRSIHWLEKDDPPLSNPKAAAILRNRFDTLAHRELYLTALGRMMHSEIGSVPAWAYECLDHWQVFS